MLILLSLLKSKPVHSFLGHRFTAATSSALAMLSNDFTKDKESLLWQWASHKDDSYHDFPPDDAVLIRQALLDWYRENRRKLPWRGDPPPYDGSTAGFGDKKAEENKKKGQKSIKNFFSSSTKNETKKKTKKEKEGAEDAQEEGEPLPVSAYGVWVSEIMLQQTRVEAVIPYYQKWMKRFPTVFDLAKASEEDVNAHWAGLGFYRRARLLHQGAQLVVSKHSGELPQTTKELLDITGIGPYTASAIASISFDTCVPVVDGNVCRVLSRLRGIANNIKAPILKDKLGWRLAEQIVQAGDGKHAGEVNQALMELGATYCAPSGTGMDDRDPLKEFYQSTKLAADFEREQTKLAKLGYECFPVDAYLEAARQSSDDDDDKLCVLCETNMATVLTEWSDAWNQGAFAVSHGPFPLAPPKASKREEVLAVGVLRSKNDKWFLVKRPKEGLLAGQWEFPSVCVWSSADQKKPKGKKRKAEVPFVETSKRSGALSDYLNTLGIPSKKSKRSVMNETVEHIFSHVRHTMWIEHEGALANTTHGDESKTAEKEVRWMSKEDMTKVGVTSGVKKILKAVEKESSPSTHSTRRKKVKKK